MQSYISNVRISGYYREGYYMINSSGGHKKAHELLATYVGNINCSIDRNNIPILDAM